MKWRKEGPYLAVSDSVPPYRVAKFVIGERAVYRASVRGEFVGDVLHEPKEAQALCERHFLIMGAQ